MPAERPEIDSQWYEQAFGALYPAIYAHRTIEAAGPEAAFAAARLSLGPAMRLLDLCCGTGRHLVHLSGRVAQAVGLDYSPELLSIAADTLARHSAPAALVRADMRAIPFVDAFDVVTNFFTSFGYFIPDDENLAVARGVARALKPGGRFLIDYFSGPYTERNLVPCSERTHNQYTITETRWIDTAAGRVNKETVVASGARIVCRLGESVRMYGLDEFIALLAAGGLATDEVFGNYSGAAYDQSQPRMIVVGHKV
ncbi:MAG: class I SAM-dependent methyltransferase [Candidatus Hydrogenedentes bacterium]|nr:class I SAM-dependent methyltransferase [Candidatus Hydrogenedentota bacterium]